MPRVEKKALNKKQGNTQVSNKKLNDAKIIKIGATVLLVAVLAFLAYLLLDKYVFKEKEPNYFKFDTLEHVTLDEFNYFLGTNEDKKNEVDRLHDVYIFVYNGDYDVCTSCESLEDQVISAAKKAKDNGYSFFVLNYNKYSEIQTAVTSLQLPDRPGLIHIEGESISSENGVLTVQSQIEYKLATISK